MHMYRTIKQADAWFSIMVINRRIERNTELKSKIEPERKPIQVGGANSTVRTSQLVFTPPTTWTQANLHYAAFSSVREGIDSRYS